MNKIFNSTKFLFVSTLFLVVCIVGYILINSTQNNPLSATNSKRLHLISIMPEAWAFFTKDARAPLIYVYDCNEGKFLNLLNVSPSNFFGISRKNRVINVEISNVLREVKWQRDSIMYKEKLDYPEQFTQLLNPDSLKYFHISIDHSLVPDLNGRYLLLIEHMPPWSMLHLENNYYKKCDIIPVILNKK